MIINVIGSGSWGTALGQVLAENGEDVMIYGVSSSEIDDINENHQNSKFFSDVTLYSELKGTVGNKYRDADVYVLAVPSHKIEEVAKKISSQYHSRKFIIVNAAKGLNPNNPEERLSQMLGRIFAFNKDLSSIITLIGPSHAEEVVTHNLTAVCAVGINKWDCETVQNLFSNEYFRVYSGTDVAGSEICAAVKNVIAIASGIAYGLGYGDNTRAALITRGLKEMVRLVEVSGGNKDTVMGLTGVGDLIVTCSSFHSRNFQAGKKIGEDDGVADFYRTNNKTVEGLNATNFIHAIAEAYNLDLPICNEVYRVLYMDSKPSKSIERLMNRELKAE